MDLKEVMQQKVFAVAASFLLVRIKIEIMVYLTLDLRIVLLFCGKIKILDDQQKHKEALD